MNVTLSKSNSQGRTKTTP